LALGIKQTDEATYGGLLEFMKVKNRQYKKDAHPAPLQAIEQRRKRIKKEAERTVINIFSYTHRDPAPSRSEEYSCGICLENERDVMLNCGHTLCGICMIGVISSNGSPVKGYACNKVTCPECRSPICTIKNVFL
jgi:hypothetical protein